MPSSLTSNDRYSYMDESKIHRLLICKFCTKPFVEPVSTPNGDRFCRSCISHVLLQSSSSETIRTSMNTEQQPSKMQSLTPVTEKLVLEMLDTLLVRCTKCGEINIHRGQLSEHENQVCKQAPVLCEASYFKCSWMGAREELEEHSAQCKFEQIRPALEFIYDEHAQINDRIQDLELQINELTNTKRFQKIDL